MKTQYNQQKPATPEEVWRILREYAVERKREAAEREKANKEWERRFKESGKRMDKMYARFNSQWGGLVESLVEGKLVELLQDRGVNVTETYSNLKRSYIDEQGEQRQREIDIIAANGKEVVAVEVKTTLRPDDVKRFLETLKAFKQFFFRYKNETIYGAIAYLKSDAEAALFAEKQGLYVIRATGDSASLINKPDFKPKAF